MGEEAREKVREEAREKMREGAGEKMREIRKEKMKRKMNGKNLFLHILPKTWVLPLLHNENRKTTFTLHLCRAVLLPLFCLFILACLAVPAGAENVSISQIDSSSLLLSQEVKLYISVTDDAGEPVSYLQQGMFSVSESADGTLFTPVRVKNFKTGANKTAGINFLLLVDNSGSMYNTLDSKKTEEASRMRIAYAKKAIRTFIAGITNPEDTIGLVAFNTNYSPLAAQTRDTAGIESAVDAIIRPSAEKKEDYTELFAALTLATDQIAGRAGRKAVIVLSDGINEPYKTGTGEDHPVFKDKIYDYSEPVLRYQEEGISCFAINFGGKGDSRLNLVSVETGGVVFNAGSGEELVNVYQAIRERILGEYRLTYLADMKPADKKYVQVSFSRDNAERKNVTRFYFSSTLFGIPLADWNWLFLLPFVLAALFWFLLTRIRFVKLNREPSLEVLNAGPGTVTTRMVTLGNKTVIGGSDQANLTISGVPGIHDSHATILYDQKEHCYTIVSDEEIAVNNKFVKKRKLEPGDVINVEGTTIVFDDEVYKQK